MATEIREYVRGCLVCQRDKASNQKPAGLLQPIEIPYNKWDHATMDRITQLPKTKRSRTAILVVVDKMTKMTRFAPVRNESTAADIAQAFVEHSWNSHGMPLQIATDRGTEFTNAFSKSLCKIIGTRHTKSTSYHPQTDGQTEQMNRTCCIIISRLRWITGMTCCQCLSLLSITPTKIVSRTLHSMQTMASILAFLMISNVKENPVKTFRRMISLAILKRLYSRQKPALSSIIRKNIMMQDTESCSSKLVTKYG